MPGGAFLALAESEPEVVLVVAGDGEEAVDGRGELDLSELARGAAADLEDVGGVDGVVAVDTDEAVVAPEYLRAIKTSAHYMWRFFCPGGKVDVKTGSATW